jgi:hypothetical protein
MEWIGDLERGFAGAIYPNRGPIAVGLVLAAVVVSIVARRRGWHRTVARHPGRTAAISVATLIVVLPLGWYLASPLVLSTTIDEPAPSRAVQGATPSPLPVSTSPSTARTLAPTPTSTPAPTPSPVRRSGSFVGADEFHFGRGTATLIETAPGTFVVRLEGFEVRNGPDLYVYLSPAADGYADGVIELGRLKADKGNQNYDVPAGLDPASVASVLIWCKQFSVQFAVAAFDG